MVKIDTSKEYIWFACHNCNDRIRFAKNKGNYWKVFTDQVEEFLLMHSGCDIIIYGE